MFFDKCRSLEAMEWPNIEIFIFLYSFKASLYVIYKNFIIYLFSNVLSFDTLHNSLPNFHMSLGIIFMKSTVNILNILQKWNYIYSHFFFCLAPMTALCWVWGRVPVSEVSRTSKCWTTRAAGTRWPTRGTCLTWAGPASELPTVTDTMARSGCLMRKLCKLH